MTEYHHKILIADDSPNIRQMLKQSLKKDGYLIKEASNGLSAYNELLSNNYDLCLLDIKMPGQNGLEVLKNMREKEKIDTAVIIITGYSETDHVIQVLRLGADNFIKKPFTIAEMRMAIKTAIRNRQLKKQNEKYKETLENEVDIKNLELKSAYKDIIEAIANSIQTRDIYTGKHAHRVCSIVIEFGKALNYSSEKLDEMEIGAMLHDIGKIGIVDSILKKPKILTPEEYDEIKKHPRIGYNIIKNIQSLRKIIPYVLYHHEWYNGTGYPEKLSGNDIPVEARIMAVADSLEAMTSDRPYRNKLSLEAAYQEILNCSGSQFDPKLVELFRELWKKQKLQEKIIELNIF